MFLSLNECLSEARRLPPFCGTNEYTLSSYLRDLQLVLSLTAPENKNIITNVLMNRIQGKALRVIETLIEPSYDEVISKLKEEFGIKRSYFSLRSEAMNVSAKNLEELHFKLNKILSLMNTKHYLNPNENELYTPLHNDNIIFDVYINFLPIHIKVLLLQNKINNIRDAYTYYIEHDLIKDISLKTATISNKTYDRNVSGQNVNRFLNRQNTSVQYQIRNNDSSQCQNKFNNSGQVLDSNAVNNPVNKKLIHSVAESMECDNNLLTERNINDSDSDIQHVENFRLPPLEAFYQ